MPTIPKINISGTVRKAKQVASNIPHEIKATGQYYGDNFKDGWNAGSRLSKIKNSNKVKTFITKMFGALSKTKVKQEHVPTILGSIGLFTPIPGASVFGYTVGVILNKLIKLFK